MDTTNLIAENIDVNGTDVSIKVPSPADLVTAAQANIDNANSNIAKWQAAIAQRETDTTTDTQSISDTQTYIATQQAIIDKVTPALPQA